MQRLIARTLVVGVTLLGLSAGDGWRANPAFAKAKGSKKSAKPADGSQRAVNACGCYQDGSGRCFCGRKGACSCPGECEPKGCEEKREKEIQKEIAAETKRAAEAERRQRKSSADAERRDDQPAAKPTKPDDPK